MSNNDKDAAQIRAEIMAQFLAMNSIAGFALTMPWIKAYKAALTPQELEHFSQACEQLVAEELIKYRPGTGPRIDTIAITKKGVYSISPEADPELIRRAVLAKFSEINAKDGYTLPEFWLQRDFERHLNEVQQDIFQGTLQDMASEGLVEYVAYPSPNLKITAVGLDKIEELGLGSSPTPPAPKEIP